MFDSVCPFWYKLRPFAGGSRGWGKISRIHVLGGMVSGPHHLQSEAVEMSRVCLVTGKRPMAGNNVSHAKNRTRRRFEPNLHTHRFWVEAEKRFVKLRVSTKGMRIIDKKGIEQVLSELAARGEKV